MRGPEGASAEASFIGSKNSGITAITWSPRAPFGALRHLGEKLEMRSQSGAPRARAAVTDVGHELGSVGAFLCEEVDLTDPDLLSKLKALSDGREARKPIRRASFSSTPGSIARRCERVLSNVES